MSRRNSAKKKKKRLARLQKKSKHVLVQKLSSLTGQGFALRKPTDSVKMSVILEAFVEPYMDHVETLQSYRTLLTTAMVAWNLSLLPEEQRPAKLEDALKRCPPQNDQTAKRLSLV